MTINERKEPSRSNRELICIFFKLCIIYIVCIYLGELILSSLNKKTNTHNAQNTYNEWLQTYGIIYTGTTTLISPNQQQQQQQKQQQKHEKENGIHIHWNIDKGRNRLQLAAAVEAEGWVGIGISEVGGMLGSDMVVFTAKTETIHDYHVKQYYSSPIMDDCQDWILIRSKSKVSDGYIIFEAERDLDTFDPQDHIIINDQSHELPPHKIIAAWGDSEQMAYHGLKHASGSIRFYDFGSDEDIFYEAMKEQSTGQFILSMNHYDVPAQETTYHFFHYNLSNIPNIPFSMDDIVHIVGIDTAEINLGTNYIHHMILHGSINEHSKKSCFFGSSDYPEMIWGWTPGIGPTMLPSVAGIPIGKKNDGFVSFCLSVHFHNPHFLDNIVVNSAIRIYVTSQLRPFIASLYVIGDVYGLMQGDTLGKGISEHKFQCSSNCTEQFFPEDVIVFQEHFHMHSKGLRALNEQWRDEKLIRIGRIDYYNFNQSGAPAAHQDEFIVKSKDRFELKCYYKSSENDIFGIRFGDEMCIAYLFYYPKQVRSASVCSYQWKNNNPFCEAEYSSRIVAENEALERKFDSKTKQCTTV